MLKKISLGIVLVVVTAVLLIAAFIFSISVERPNTPPQITSVALDQTYEANARQAAAWMESLYAQHLLPSLSVAVGIDGQLVWQGVIGYADLDDEKLADISTTYRIGSISKPMTAVVAMRLQEKGIFSIDDNFSNYVEDYSANYYSANYANISIKQLLSHQAGVRHYIEISETFNFTEYATTREAAAVVEQDALLFEPGHGFNYSTYGYTLASLAMEAAAARPFEQLMQEELFSPLGLHTTSFNKVGETDALNRSIPYLEIGQSLYTSPDPNVSNKYAGGGFLSTPTDLVKFGNALLNETLLRAETLETLWTPVNLAGAKPNPQNYALGFRVGGDDLGEFVHHGGKSVGGYSFLLIYPQAKVVVAFTSNIMPEGNSVDRLTEAQKLAEIFSAAR